MSKPPRDESTSPSRTYFITASTDGKRFFFQSERVVNLLIATIIHYRDQKKYDLHEFVLMPNHLHLLITTREETTLERAVQLIKGGFSFRVKKELGITSEIWQRGYVDHRVRDRSDCEQHRKYIHANPVRAGIASDPKQYSYSSASGLHVLDCPPQGLKPTA